MEARRRTFLTRTNPLMLQPSEWGALLRMPLAKSCRVASAWLDDMMASGTTDSAN